MAPTPDTGPEFFRPPAQGWIADDLDRIPDLPTHTELLDGGLFIRPHSRSSTGELSIC
jgi:hypothetical protein